jgi:hypothetical protein
MRTMFIYYIIPGYYCDVADTPVITYTSYDCPKTLVSSTNKTDSHDIIAGGNQTY